VTVKKFLDVIHEDPSALEASRVDCGTCPVSLKCVLGQDGTGWTFNCCRATAVNVTTGDGRSVKVVVDCAKHAFEQKPEAASFIRCVLCSGEIMDTEVRAARNHGSSYLYLPTVHAKVPVGDRVTLWKRTHARAMRRP
jgi:hypothetical protein